MQRFVPLGSLQFDPEGLALYDRGKLVALAPLQARILAELVKAEGDVVSTAQMRAALWGDAPVEERNLNQQMYLLRRVLRIDPSLAIVNVPRRGYRLTVASASAVRPSRPRLRPRWVVAAMSVALAVAVGTGLMLRMHAGSTLGDSAKRDLELANFYATSEGPDHLDAAAVYYRNVVLEAPQNAAGYGGLAFIDARRAVVQSNDARNRLLASARSEAAAALARNSRDSTALTALGIVASADGRDFCKAKDFFNAAVAADPASELPRSWRARFLLSIGEFDRAGRDFAAVGKYVPTSGYAVGSLGEWLVLNRSYARASTILSQAVDLGNHPGFTRYWLARAYYQRGLYDKALRLTDVLLGMYPGEASALVLRLRIEAAKGDMPSAVADFRRLEKIDRIEQTDPVALASADVALGKTQDALHTVRRYLLSGQVDLDEVGRIRTDPDLDALRAAPAPEAPLTI
jgi:DNA-binding winged helix-turn-helix (wHTH) protein/Tfp pilus assembly protein PilF